MSLHVGGFQEGPLDLMVGELWGRRLEKGDVITVGGFRNKTRRCLPFESR